MVEQLGGPSTPAVGWALGIERLLLLLETMQLTPIQPAPSIFMITSSPQAYLHALTLADQLRLAFSIAVIVSAGGSSFKTQFKKADQSGAKLALILGEEEMLNHTISIKNLREREEQNTITQATLLDYIARYMEY